MGQADTFAGDLLSSILPHPHKPSSQTSIEMTEREYGRVHHGQASTLDRAARDVR